MQTGIQFFFYFVSFNHALILLFISPSGDSTTLELCLVFSLSVLQFLSLPHSIEMGVCVSLGKLHICSGHNKEWSGGPLQIIGEG